MKKRIICLSLISALIVCILPIYANQSNTSTTLSDKPLIRQTEVLNRGAIGSTLPKGGVFLSWRLLGSEPMDTVFNVYKNGAILTDNLNNTNYTDETGLATDVYTVAPVISGVVGENSSDISVLVGYANSSQKDVPYSYFDIPLDTPSAGSVTYEANDASVGDVDGDGEYEIILKWDPSNAKDNSKSGKTSNVYIDCYKMDGTMLWRIDLGVNIRAGAHYTQFQVFDYDGDGMAEVAMKTAPGSSDGMGNYVTDAGNTDAIKTADNTASYVNSSGYIITGHEYLTIFNGLTGAAMQTIEYDPPRGTTDSWGKPGDNTNRVDRFLAGTAYLDGVHPSLVMCRGYYGKAIVATYDWDGKNLNKRFRIDSTVSGNGSLKSQGNHNLAMADVDNDGFDEIVYGSAIIDHDGTMLYSTNWGHGDSLHVSDFNNDGKQDIFKSIEDSPDWGSGLFDATGIKWHKKASGDTGRGIMDYFSPTLGVLAWDSSNGVRTYDGNIINDSALQDKVYPNFSIYWDGDLCREHLSGTYMSKWRDDSNSFTRLWTIYTDNPVGSNNSTKATPCLQADLFGDWREEIVMRHADNTALRVFTSLCQTDYKFTTLMHDSQYRNGVAWQNTAYNQPPHLSYYIGYDKDVSEYIQPSIYYAPLPETTITVIDSSTNLPASNAVVDINNQTFVADSNGVVTARLLDGIYDYTVSLHGYLKQSGSITIHEGQGASENVEIEPKTYIYKSQDDDAGSAFTYSGDTGATLSFSQENHEWKFEQDSTNGGRNFIGNFSPVYGGNAELEFIFNTGGRKDASDAWNWKGRAYSYDIQLLDDTGNIVLGISQAYSESGSNEAQYYTGSVSKTNITNGKAFGAPNITKRSSSTWYINVEIDFDNQIATLTFADDANENGYIISDIPITASIFSDLKIGSTATGNVTWGPKVKNVLYWADNVTPPPTRDPSLPTPTPTLAPTPDPTSKPTEAPIYSEDWTFDSIDAGTIYCDTEDNNKISNSNGEYLTVAKAESDTVLPSIVQREEGNNYLELTDSTTAGDAKQDSWSYDPLSPLDGEKVLIDFDFKKNNTDKDTILARIFDNVNVSPDNTFVSATTTDGRAFEIKTNASSGLTLTDFFSQGSSATKGNETTIPSFTYKTNTWNSVRLEYAKSDNTVKVSTKADTATDYTLCSTVKLGSGTTKGSGAVTLSPTKIQCSTPGGGAVTLGVDNISIGIQGGVQPPVREYDYTINDILTNESDIYLNITKNSASSSTAKVIFATYSEDGLLTNISINDITMNVGDTIDFTVAQKDQNAPIMRAFIWDSLTGLVPLSNVIEK